MGLPDGVPRALDCRMTLERGVLAGPGLTTLIGGPFFDKLVDAGWLEPIP